MQRILHRAYFNLNYKTAFGSKTAFVNHFSKQFPRKDIIKWIEKQKTINEYASYKKKTYKHQFFLCNSVYSTLLCDLMDVQKHAKYNKGVRFVLIICDCLSRYTWAIPLKTKRPSEVTEKFKQLFKRENFKPKVSCAMDYGMEFRGVFATYLKSIGVQPWYSMNPPKISIVERKILDIRRRLAKYCHFNDTKNWLPALEKVIYNLNHTFNRSIQMTPAEVIKDKANEKKAFLTLYSKKLGKMAPDPEFQVGEKVIISRLRSIFEKSYNQNFTSERFIISKVLPRDGQNLFELTDENKEKIRGKFNKLEIIRVSE